MKVAGLSARPSVIAEPRVVDVAAGAKGSTRITWNVGDDSLAELAMIDRARPDALYVLARNRGSGVREVEIARDVDYEFRLFRLTPERSLVAKTSVTTTFMRREVVADVTFLAGGIAAAVIVVGGLLALVLLIVRWAGRRA